MATKPVFRSEKSLQAERITRDMVPGYLAERGFTDIRDERRYFGSTVQQIVRARSPEGALVGAHVRLCWHKAGDNPREARYSATQLLSKISGGDWLGSLDAKVERDRANDVTHTLIVQRVADQISDAVLVPLDQLVEVWVAQRDMSAHLIESGRMGRKRKNHAMNGSSPTLWLHDEAAPEMRQALLAAPGVLDLSALHPATESINDTLDDLPGMDPALLGSEGAPRVRVMRSAVKRDPKVRAAVALRAQGRCEYAPCGATRDYPGFLDVHHILGVEVSDRVHTCVALCPNCHRAAHFSPDAAQINSELASFAAQFA